MEQGPELGRRASREGSYLQVSVWLGNLGSDEDTESKCMHAKW